MSFNAIRENKILAKVFESTVFCCASTDYVLLCFIVFTRFTMAYLVSHLPCDCHGIYFDN